MEVLVTGATGYIGRAVVQLLADRGERIRVLVRPDSDTSSLEELPVELHVGDVTDRGSVVRAARGVEAVIHAAAWVSLYTRQLEDMRRVNVKGVENVASAALEVAVRRVVHVSSLVAIGATTDGTPVTEEFSQQIDPKAVPVPYLLTKREAEGVAFRFARMGMDVVVVNPTLVVGAPDPRGVDPGGILRFLQRKIPARIHGGANYVDLWDVAHGIVAALDRGRSGERYILGGENLTFREYYAMLEAISGVQAPRFRVPYRLAHAVAYGMEKLEQVSGRTMPLNQQLIRLAAWQWFADSSKARLELQLPHTPLRDSMAQAIAYYRSRNMV